MLSLRDFIHLPELADQIDLWSASPPPLTLLAGMEPFQPGEVNAASPTGLPTGRASLLGFMIDAYLASQPEARAAIISRTPKFIRPSREYKRRMDLYQASEFDSTQEAVGAIFKRRVDLLAIEQLAPHNIGLAASVLQAGRRLVGMLETPLRASESADQLAAWDPALAAQVGQVFAIQRLARLCPQCRQPAYPTQDHFAELLAAWPELEGHLPAASETSGTGAPKSPALTSLQFYTAPGCPACRQSGRQGEVWAVEIWVGGESGPGRLVLPLGQYLWGLAGTGYLSLDDLIAYPRRMRLRLAYDMQYARQQLEDLHASLGGKNAELTAANRVLQARTTALFSLEDLNQALIAGAGLHATGNRVCRRARELCNADRSVLYFRRNQAEAEVLSVGGWPGSMTGRILPAEQVFPRHNGSVSHLSLPPGLTEDELPQEEVAPIQAGLAVPLVAQGEQVGLMIVQSTTQRMFTPGEIALLQTFANQAALGLQRANLVSELRAKITELEAAQAELVGKERLERDLELARQVQQSVLPRQFPVTDELIFAAYNRPARQVGGDFYDIFQLREGQVGVVIADVSDKGLPAALYMTLTRSLLLAEARRAHGPQEALQGVNDLLLELGGGQMFVTVFYGVIDLRTRAMTYARAGQDHPLLLRDGEVSRLEGRGRPLGILPVDELELEEGYLPLQPGDLLALYTDGLTDIFDQHGQATDRRHLAQRLPGWQGLHPDEIGRRLFADLDELRGSEEQFDDMTLLLVQVKPDATRYQ